MAERPPNRFQKKQQPIIEYESRSDSEESRPVRTRQPTARYVDQISPPQRARNLAKKRKRVQQRQSQLEELKRQDRAARLDLSEPDSSDSQTQPAKRVLTNLEIQGAVNNLEDPTHSNDLGSLRFTNSYNRMVDEIYSVSGYGLCSVIASYQLI